MTTSAHAVNPAVRWAFYVFVFSIPLEYPIGLPLQIHSVTGALFLLVACLQPEESFRRPSAAVWWLAGYLWVFLALAIAAEHVSEAIRLFLTFLLVALLFWTGSNLMRHGGVARGAIGSFVLGCTTIAALDLLGVGTSFVDAGTAVRRTLFDQDANFLAGRMALALVATVALVASLRTHAPTRASSVAAAGLLAPALIAAGSRGALLAAAAGLAALVIGSDGRRAALMHLAIVLIAGGVLIGVGSRSAPLRTRIAKTVEQGSLAGRESIYPEAWQLFREKPLLGWGPVDARYRLRLRTAAAEIDWPRRRQERDAHNLILELLIACGLVGTIPFLAAIGCTIAAAWRARVGPHGVMPLALVVVVIALSMSANWSATKDAWLVFAYALAARRPFTGGLV